MALFFDQAWFDVRLEEMGATRDDVAKLLRMTGEQIAEIWKDQREISAQDVVSLARLLNVSAAEIAEHAGVATPVPSAPTDLMARLDEMSGRLQRIERLIIETLVLTRKS